MLLFVAKLDNPTFSYGVRKKIIIINKILTINPISFNISLIYFKNFNFIIIFKIIITYYNYYSISKIWLKTLVTLSPESIDSKGSFLKRWRKHRVIIFEISSNVTLSRP